jgi:drug/metabolite transporter (DMT)-like permease
MGIGACVALIAIGAVLTFATELHLAGVDVNAIGVILMVAGALGLVVTLQVSRPRRPRESAMTRPGGYGPGASPHYAPPAAPGPYAQQPPPGPHYR